MTEYYCCDGFKLAQTFHKAVEYNDFGKGIQPYINVEIKDKIDQTVDKETGVITTTTKLLQCPLDYCMFCGAKKKK